MTYVLYNQDMETQGSFKSIQEMRNYLCEWKYKTNDKTYMDDTFDYIRKINWFFDIIE